MPQFRYRTFLFIYALSNSIVWFFLLFGLSHLVYEHFSAADGLSHAGAWAFFTLTPLVSSVLASQGAIVNLRAQYLIRRFTAPSHAREPHAPPENPWLVSLRTAVPVALLAALLTSVAMRFVRSETVGLEFTARTMGGIGAAITFLLVLTVADREFRRFQFHLGHGGHPVSSLRRYIGQHLILPWAFVNGALNGVFAWMVYHQSSDHAAAMVSLAELRYDLTITTVLICVCTALAVFPEVDTDFAAGMTPPASALPAMPPLWRRYVLLALLGATVWLVVTGLGRSLGVFPLSLSATIALKVVWGAGVAILATALCARWRLARCHARLEAVAPIRYRVSA